MDFEMGDPFDGAIPNAPLMQEPDYFDDLLGVQVPLEDSELPVPDFPGEHVQLSASPPKKTILIKKEPSDIPFTLRFATNTIYDPVEISDTEDPDSIYKHGTKMSDGVIILSDGEEPEEIIIFDDGSTSVAIKKENPDVELLGATRGLVEASDLGKNELPTTRSPNLGKSFLRRVNHRAKRTTAEIERMQQIQRLYAEKALRRNLGPEGVRAVATPEHFQSSELGARSHPSNDEISWMKAGYVSDEDNGKNFRTLKKSYVAKVKADSNTIEDDIAFTKAEKAERLRLARLQAEYENARGYSDDDDSDDGLFVSPSSPTSSRLKRRVIDDLGAEDENTDSRSAKQRKPNSNDKRPQQGLDPEQETKMMAGLEEFIRKTYGDEGEESGKKGNSGKKHGSKRTKRRSKKTGYLNGSNSLLTSNVYEDADANLNREALPVSGHTNKQKALAALVASVPLGTTQEDAITQKNRILKATVILGRNIKGTCKADGEDNWKLTGMKSSLRHHQVIGASFMKERETGGEEPLGGILADAMGMGKTVEIIALMISNPPPRGEKHRATLIVCTPGLLAQWERELKKHTEAGHLDIVLRHYSTNRLCGNGAASTMQERDVILTTYQEVVKSYPRFEAPEDIRDQDELKAWWEKQWNQEREVLHQVQFYRVVLDESQAIKNHKTHTSIACRALMAKHRWCCSATPIYNTVEELYPSFKFLRVPYTGSFKDFQDNYCKEGSDDCNSRLHCLLDQIMCRRTYKDTILGAPIVKLPKHSQRTIDIGFSPVEKAIYRRVFKKFVASLNKASAEGTLEKHPGLGLVAFLRLRQLCAHTFLVQEVLEELLDLESINNMEQELICGSTMENNNDRNLLAALRRMIEAKPEVVEENEGPEQVQSGELAARFESHLKALRANANWAELNTRTKCQSCGDPPESAFVTSCLHVYCEECLQGLANKAAAKDQDETACLVCGVVFTGAEPCAGLKELEWDDRWLLNELAVRKKRPKKVNMEWVFHENKLVMSAKTTAVCSQIEEWLKEEPDKKIIIFSQFHMIMQILEKVCQKKKWKYCSYHGKMSHQARDKVIKDFEEDDVMKIMIASLKCGGVGLNLTMASKVICIDLWFNSCVERQAFCRVYRIGQLSETFISRFIVNNSADGKLIDMQLRKNALISRAMEDRSVMSKLTPYDVLRLFGEVKLDNNRRPFVHLDDDEKLDSLFEKKGKD